MRTLRLLGLVSATLIVVVAVTVFAVNVATATEPDSETPSSNWRQFWHDYVASMSESDAEETPTPEPTPSPSPTPTPQPTATPTATPTPAPTSTPIPTPTPTSTPTPLPTPTLVVLPGYDPVTSEQLFELLDCLTEQMTAPGVSYRGRSFSGGYQQLQVGHHITQIAGLGEDGEVLYTLVFSSAEAVCEGFLTKTE